MTDVPIGRLGPVSGRARDVSVTLTDLSCRQTSTGRRFPYPDFGSDFIEALHRALVAPRTLGLFRWRQVCPWCDTSLAGIAVEPVPITTEIALTRIPPIRVDLKMPGIKCPGCDRSLVMIDDRGLDSDLSDALIDAFRAASLVPGP
jgi:hypothetical protein